MKIIRTDNILSINLTDVVISEHSVTCSTAVLQGVQW